MPESLSRAFESLRDFVAGLGWDAIGNGSSWEALWAMVTSSRGLAFIATVIVAFVLGILVGVFATRPRRPTPIRAPERESVPPSEAGMRPVADPAAQPETPPSPDVPAAALRDTLKERGLSDTAIAARVQTFVDELPQTRQTLEALRGEDAETAPLVETARGALDQGDLDGAVRHLDLARGRFSVSGRALAKHAGSLRLAAATSATLAGDLEMSRCDYVAAAKLFARALGLVQVTETDRIIPLLTKQATAAFRGGAGREADTLLQRAIQVTERAHGKNHPEVAKALSRLAFVRFATSRPDDADRLYRRALAINEAALGPDHPDVATDLNNLAQLLLRRGERPAAELLLKRALTIRRKAPGPAHPETVHLAQAYAGLLRQMDRGPEADQILADIAAARRQAEQAAE